MLKRTLWLLPLTATLIGCATPQFPARPEVNFYRDPEPTMHEADVKLIGARPLIRKIPVEVCLTERDQRKLTDYFEAADLWLSLWGPKGEQRR